MMRRPVFHSERYYAKEVTVIRIKISEISINPRRREVNPKDVRELADYNEPQNSDNKKLASKFDDE